MADSAPVILIEGMSKRMGRRGVLAVDGLDLLVHSGQILGLTGPNGAGKSITLKILLGLARPTQGRVELFGEPVRAGCPALARVGALVDGPGFVPHLTGRENLRVFWQASGRPEADAGFERVQETAGLGEALDRPYQTYSHGMRYRLGLAQALLGKPDLLLLDEPTTGLDPVQVREVRATIARVAAAGATVVFSSHLLHEVEEVCTDVAVMQNGRLIAGGTLAAVLGSSPSLQDAYLRLLEQRAA